VPAELRRIVEFLNTQMDPAEVLAIEIKQYVGEGMRSLVPRVVGQTEKAQQKKDVSQRKGRVWNSASFLENLEDKHSRNEVTVAMQLLDWAIGRSLSIWWGKGSEMGSFYVMLYLNRIKFWTFSVWTTNQVQIEFQWIQSRQPFDDASMRMELRDKLNSIPGVAIRADSVSRRPTFPLSVLIEASSLRKFTDAFDWYIQEIRAFNGQQASQ
jgi:hypothetical protein